MKHSSSLLAMLLLFNFTVEAQVKIGFRAGLNISNQTNPFAYNYSIKPTYSKGIAIAGANGAMFVEFPVAKKTLMRISLGSTNVGYRLPEAHDQSNNVTSPAQTVRLNYLTVPIQLLYPFVVKSGIVWLGIGPYGAVILEGRIKEKSGTTRIHIGTGQFDYIRGGDFGLSPTIGFRHKSGLLFGIDYSVGLDDVNRDVGTSRNLSWSFYLGYTLK